MRLKEESDRVTHYLVDDTLDSINEIILDELLAKRMIELANVSKIY